VAVLFVSVAIAAPAATEFVFSRHGVSGPVMTPLAEALGMAIVGAALIFLSGRVRGRIQ
jgi:hypothetical protein